MTGIFDAHHHLWDTRVLDYGLFRQSAPALDRPFLLEEYEREARELGVTGSLWVEAASAGADGTRELEWATEHVDGSSIVEALVAWVTLEDATEEDFDRLAGRRVVGVRRSFELEEPSFPLRVVRGAQLAGERGLVVDVVLFPPALPAVLELVDRCPGTQFVLDHLAKPEIAVGGWQPWASQLRELARRPNIVAKLSGLVTEADRARWTVADLRPYVEHALETFGPGRLLYGSDWPVLTLAGSHRRWLEAALELLEPLSREEREAVLAGNARRIYLASS